MNRSIARVGALLPALLLLSSACSSPPATAADTANRDPKAAAAAETAREGANCRAIGDFYWEIGDGRGAKASGSVGDSYSANGTIKIASASKFVWGAYVLEKIGRNREPDSELLEALEMKSGYTSYNPIACLLQRTVGGCLTARSNAVVKPGDIGRFSYGGGHDQKMAADLGLGRMNAAELTREVRSYIGNDLDISYAKPAPAGGMEGTPAGYAAFLRKIINGDLRMKQFLGYRPVCTLPGSCPNAVSSPVKEAWHYSVNHWVEDAPGTGDGAFSSPGLEGFYPWISADKTTYGVLAREKLRLSAYWESVLCGRDIRKAYFSGKPVR